MAAQAATRHSTHNTVKRLLSLLDRIGSIGALIAAVAAPCCFPLFAALAAGIGFGALDRYEGFVLYAFQFFTLLALVGLATGFSRNRRVGPLALGLLSAAALGYALYGSYSVAALYGGLFGLLAATGWNRFTGRFSTRTVQPILRSVITCPQCGHRSEETMPTDSCWFFYECPACHTRLKPKEGHCCVFCSYGSVPCPPKQTEAPCCS